MYYVCMMRSGKVITHDLVVGVNFAKAWLIPVPVPVCYGYWKRTDMTKFQTGVRYVSTYGYVGTLRVLSTGTEFYVILR